MIIGQGNFGNIDGDSAAAMRYTEAKMSKISGEMLKDLDKETVEWRPNYDNTKKEPEVLPVGCAKFTFEWNAWYCRRYGDKYSSAQSWRSY